MGDMLALSPMGDIGSRRPGRLARSPLKLVTVVFKGDEFA
jgi:hypothetical protein